MIIGFDQPCFPRTKILDQFLILSTHVAGPQHFRIVDICVVKDPLIENEIVVGTVAHDDEVARWCSFELVQNACPLKVLRIL